MHAFAQTNIQLYNQLLRAARPAPELELLHASYELALELFAGHFRGSGKPFLAHAVGVASILVELRAPMELVAAGVLHAAYTEGEFGDGARGVTESKRERVRAHVGAGVERRVLGYSALRWDDAELESAAARATTLDAEGRGLLLLRLANELEDHLDAQVLYCHNAKHGPGRWDSRLRHGAAAANALDEPALAEAFTHARLSLERLTVPAALVGERRFSFVQPPLSHVPRNGSAWRYQLSSHAGLQRREAAARALVRRWLARFGA